MNPFALRTAILWMHAIGGVVWIGASASFVIAASAANLEEADGRAMVQRIAPAINRIGVAAMVFIMLSGMLNIYIAGTMRRFTFSNTFVGVLCAKIGIFVTMYAVLSASFRAEPMLRSSDAAVSQRAVSRLILLNAAVLGLGATALLLGLWLLGS